MKSNGIYVSKRGKRRVVSGIIDGKPIYLGTWSGPNSKRDAENFAKKARRDLGISEPRSREKVNPRKRLAQLVKNRQAI